VNGIIALSIILVAAALAGFAIHRVTRPPQTIPPRRRMLNRARAVATDARDSLDQIDNLLDRYRPGVDAVGESLIAEIKTVLRNHDRKMRELDA
jgi:hypothetical protein